MRRHVVTSCCLASFRAYRVAGFSIRALRARVIDGMLRMCGIAAGFHLRVRGSVATLLVASSALLAIALPAAGAPAAGAPVAKPLPVAVAGAPAARLLSMPAAPGSRLHSAPATSSTSMLVPGGPPPVAADIGRYQVFAENYLEWGGAAQMPDGAALGVNGGTLLISADTGLAGDDSYAVAPSAELQGRT